MNSGHNKRCTYTRPNCISGSPGFAILPEAVDELPNKPDQLL